VPIDILARVMENDLPPKDVYSIVERDLDGYVAMVGQNALSNEQLVSEHRDRHPDCLWLHVVWASGSHVILCIDGKNKEAHHLDPAIKAAGKLAIEYSKSRGNTVVRVACLKNIVKPEGAGIGIWWAKSFSTFEAI
jgi:predicted ribosome quality control (RQC) complex YloA/Tae2 family protein